MAGLDPASNWRESCSELCVAKQEVIGWSLGKNDFVAIDAILRENIRNPVEPEFMAPPARETAEPETISVG